MVVEREYQISQIVYQAVFNELLDVLSLISSQLTNDRAGKPLCTGQPAPLISLFCLRGSPRVPKVRSRGPLI